MDSTTMKLYYQLATMCCDHFNDLFWLPAHPTPLYLQVHLYSILYQARLPPDLVAISVLLLQRLKDAGFPMPEEEIDAWTMLIVTLMAAVKHNCEPGRDNLRKTKTWCEYCDTAKYAISLPVLNACERAVLAYLDCDLCIEWDTLESFKQRIYWPSSFSTLYQSTSMSSPSLSDGDRPGDTVVIIEKTTTEPQCSSLATVPPEYSPQESCPPITRRHSFHDLTRPVDDALTRECSPHRPHTI